MKNSEAVKFALKNVLLEGVTDIFPRPFEVDLLKQEKFYNKVRDELIDTLNDVDKVQIKNDRDFGKLLDVLRVHPLQHVLYPKKEAFDFRRCALVDPLDTLKYTSIVISLSREIEKARIARGRNIVFSYRLHLQPNGSVFNPKYSFTSFNEHTRLQIKKTSVKVLVKCDISNFYDRLNLHRLESNLHSLPIEKKRVKLINELLLFWANRDSYGLPVGGNASRILAEAALIEVDNFLLSHGVQFARFVDDYRLFAKDAKQAHYWMSLLVERLSLEGLLINQSKTQITDVSSKNEVGKSKSENLSKKEDQSFDIKSIKKPIRIISGYSGAIPIKFKQATESEIEKIKKIDSQEIISRIESSTVIKPDEFKEYCKSILYNQKWSRFAVITEVLEKFPQFSSYLVDLLIRNESKIPKEVCDKIRDKVSEWMQADEYIPEFMSIAFVRLLSHERFKNIEVLFSVFRSLKRNAGNYIGRAILEGLESHISRGEALEIRQYYNRADRWEKRQIIKIANKNLMKDEKSAWFKNIKMNESNDIFTIGVIDFD
ncbi:MAG: RNA-directed DNA polymerase [Lentisphaeraceae bacterium]|nr:RNA-directed DNA polymerase [Lentisphaeraceae bacterium]